MLSFLLQKLVHFSSHWITAGLVLSDNNNVVTCKGDSNIHYNFVLLNYELTKGIDDGLIQYLLGKYIVSFEITEEKLGDEMICIGVSTTNNVESSNYQSSPYLSVYLFLIEFEATRYRIYNGELYDKGVRLAKRIDTLHQGILSTFFFME